ncbi:MAG: ribonuclease HII [Turneriella sp.]|nr:ribonuclease HII [Turneriella sp.]
MDAGQNHRFLAQFFFQRGEKRFSAVIGVDEVGRGALFGPLGVGAVLLTPESWQQLPTAPWFPFVRDSKKLSPKLRRNIAPLIEKNLPAAVSFVAVRYIDRHNILNAVRYGIYRVVQALLWRVGLSPEQVLVIADGNYAFRYPALGMARPMPEVESYAKADDRFFPVAAASIVAKVRRDNLMVQAASRFPQFALERNAGYATLSHRRAIQQYGMTRFHRRSFIVRKIAQ